jgi:hypothetical protein
MKNAWLHKLDPCLLLSYALDTALGAFPVTMTLKIRQRD